jgi:hypothetical protein
MKTCDLYGTKIEAYTPTELESLRTHGKIAEDIWFNEWQRQGEPDGGTCCGGKAIRVWYVGKGKRLPVETSISRCGWVQGNIPASDSVAPALEYLKAKGINAEYYDGWMD